MRPFPKAAFAACALLAIAVPNLALAESDPLSDPGVRAVRQAFPIQGLHLFDTRARGAGCADTAAGLVWCATGAAYETTDAGTYARTLGYNLDAAGRVVYVIQTRREYPLARDKFDETVKALGARFGRPATTLTYQGKNAEGDEFQSVVAYWGNIKLVRLNPAELRIAAQGGTLGRGPLVDHRMDVRASARNGEPVYKVEGTAGAILELRSLFDVRADYVMRAVYQPAFTGEHKAEPPAPKPLVFKEYPLDPGLAAPMAVIRAEEERLAAIERARRAEEERLAAIERAKREAEERKLAEERRIAEEKKAAEERARRAEEERKAAEERAKREAAERKAAEERRIAEEKAAAERKAAEDKARREAAERRAAEERARREEAERKAAEARRLAEEKARREEAERKAAEAKRLAEERARLEEAERKAAAERRAIEERFRRAEAEYRASLERAQRAEAERRAAEEKARQAEAERKAAEEKARKIEAERKAAEERQIEDRRAAERRAAEERARRDDAERRSADERRSAEEKRAAEARKAAEERRTADERRRAEERRASEERPSAPRAEAPAVRAPAKPEEPSRASPPQFAGPVPGASGPAAPSPQGNRDEWRRMAVAQSRNSTAAWIFERVRDRISDDVMLRARAIFPGDGRSALEIAFECNIGAGKRLAAHVRAFDERSNAAIQLPVEDGRTGVVRGHVTLDEEPPQTAYLFPERGERQASVVEIPLAHDDIRKNTPRTQAWLRHYRVVLKIKLGQGEVAAAIYPYVENLRRVLEACEP
jgi:hypothetical protein